MESIVDEVLAAQLCNVRHASEHPKHFLQTGVADASNMEYILQNFAASSFCSHSYRLEMAS